MSTSFHFNYFGNCLLWFQCYLSIAVPFTVYLWVDSKMISFYMNKFCIKVFFPLKLVPFCKFCCEKSQTPAKDFSSLVRFRNNFIKSRQNHYSFLFFSLEIQPCVLIFYSYKHFLLKMSDWKWNFWLSLTKTRVT